MPTSQSTLDKVRVFNKYVTNKILIHIAGRSFGHFAILTHEGRRSGKKYRIPVIAEPPAEAPSTGTERTCFLRSRGFYIEWLRDDWFNDTGRVTAAPPFEPGDEAVIQTARLWLQKKDDMERRFTETKIPLAGGAP